MSDRSRLPDDFTLEECQRYLMRICLEIVASKDPTGLFPWFDFLEREIEIKKEQLRRMEKVHKILQDAGIDPDYPAPWWRSPKNAKKPPPTGR